MSARKKKGELERLCPHTRWDLLLERLRQISCRWWLLPLTLVALTVVVWARSFSVSVLGWDDTTYLFYDGRLNRISLGNMWGIVTRPFFANYHPVTTLTFLFDRAVWDTWTPGFHITQLAFYVGGVLVLYFLFKTLMSCSWTAFAGAALFSTHTVHVESVTWIASRKDVVCFFFYTASILAYVRYTKRGEYPWRLYAVSVVLGAAAMLSKGYAVVLPAVLFAYDLCFGKRDIGREIIDKLPFGLLAVLTTVFTVLAQDQASAIVNPNIALWQRAAALLQVFAFYVGRALLPVRLSAMYVLSEASLNLWISLLGAALGVWAAAGFTLLRRRLPAAAFGIALFVLPLGTVMNVFFTLRTWMADRYLFLPTIGSVLALTSGIPWLLSRVNIARQHSRWVIPVTAPGVVLLYAGLTVARIGVWTSPVLLWSDTLRKQTDLGGSGPVTANELAAAYVSTLPDPRAAIWLADAYKRQGKSSEAEKLMAWILSMRGEIETGDEIHFARLDIEAEKYDDAINKLRPIAEGQTWLAPIALVWMGIAYERKGKLEAARSAHLKALQLYHTSGRVGTPAMLELAGIEFRMNRFPDAAKWYRRAHKEDPMDPRATFFLGVSLEHMEQVEKAFGLYEQTLVLKGKIPPDIPFSFADVHLQMGIASEKLGRLTESLQHFEKVLRFDPDHPQQEAVRAKIDHLHARINQHDR